MKFSNQEIEEILRMTTAMVSAHNDMARMPSCINCRKENCKYRPQKNGEMLRLNCPLWTAEPEPEDKPQKQQADEDDKK